MIALVDALKISTTLIEIETKLKQLGEDMRVDGIDPRQVQMFENAQQALSVLKQSLKNMDERGEVVE